MDISQRLKVEFIGWMYEEKHLCAGTIVNVCNCISFPDRHPEIGISLKDIFVTRSSSIEDYKNRLEECFINGEVGVIRKSPRNNASVHRNSLRLLDEFLSFKGYSLV